jgi:hypothetical protein
VDQLRDIDTAKAVATQRAGLSPTGIGAAVLRNETGNYDCLDGLMIRLIVTDRAHGFGEVLVLVPRAHQVATEVVEERLERYASQFRRDMRFADLVAADGDQPVSFPDLWFDSLAA